MGRTTRVPHRNSYHPSKMITIPHEFFKTIEVGNFFHAYDSTANIGAETTPADTIEIYFTTPATTEIIMSFGGFCSTAAAVFTLREGWSAGGGASGDAVTAICLTRGTKKKTSNLTLLKQADTITSGGTILAQQTLTAASRVGGSFSDDHPWSLAASTNYSISIYLAAAGVADIGIHWYERTLVT